MKRFLTVFLALFITVSALPSPVGAQTIEEDFAPSYEAAMEILSRYDDAEVLLETDLCTVFRSFFVSPRGSYPELRLVYKPGSPLGDGTVVKLPCPDGLPDHMNLGWDGETLIYSYPLSPDADMTEYTVDLSTGEAQMGTRKPSHYEIIDWYCRDAVLEDCLNAPDCSAILLREDISDSLSTYSLYLVYYEPEVPERVKRLILPSTVDLAPSYPTDRAPEHLSLSEDGATLIYVYTFTDTLYDEAGNQLHDVGSYIYRVDTATGDLQVEHSPTPVALPDWTGPLSKDAEPTLIDTGRDYLIYYWYASGIYASKDGVTWTDLSDRQWVKDASPYIYAGVRGLGTREFEVIWTGSEYMMRQSLLDDPRGAYSMIGDSPRNRIVTFLDEDFNIIGERRFDRSVTAIRFDGDTYYATVNGVEIPFTREEVTSIGFTDVKSGDWFAPYVKVCVENGLMQGVGGGKFAPEETMTLAEAATLAARLHHIQNGGDGRLPQAPVYYGVLEVTFENGQTLTFQNTDYQMNMIPMSTVFGADVSPEQLATLDWMPQEGYTPATLMAGLPTPVGLLPCLTYWNGAKENGQLRLIAPSEATEEEKAAFFDATSQLHILQRPLPEDWYRDAVYYLEGVLGAEETETITGQRAWYGDAPLKPATRADFVEILHTTAADLLTPKRNDISTYPDAETEGNGKWLTEKVLDFYNAGILTGKDEFGAFDQDGTLTRAEAAAFCARLLEPDLRLSFTPTPEKQGKITLTTQDGTQLTGYIGDTDCPFFWGGWRHGEYGYLCYNLTDDQAEWGETQSGSATLEIGGKVYNGKIDYWLPLGNWIFSFHPEDYEDSGDEASVAIHDALYANRPAPDKETTPTPDSTNKTDKGA